MEMVDPDRIAELVEAARDGSLPDALAAPARSGARVRTVDFSRPTKFGADQQRRLGNAAEIFCQTAATRLSSELRWPIELEILNTSQLTWSGSQAQIPANSLLSVIEIEATGTRLLMAIEQAFVLVGLECMLGGAPERPARDRRLSEIDWSLARGLIASLLAPMSLVWQEMGGVTLTLGETGFQDTSQVASISEPTLTTFIEIRINGQSYALALLIPWASVEPIEGIVAGSERRSDDDGPGGRDPLTRPLARVPVTVRTEIASTEMTLADVLKLAPGAAIGFDAVAEEGVGLFAGTERIARARPGRQGPRRAVQLTEFIQERE
jgi:flagellar motor switch protein FliM